MSYLRPGGGDRMSLAYTGGKNISDSGLRFQVNIIGICFAGRKAGLGNPMNREPGRLIHLC